MTEDDSFCLRWSNHKATVMTVFDSLLKSQTLVDVTLASEGKWLRAHRLVLSACSKYFEELLTFQPEKNAILYMKDVPFSHLEALIAFMYRGEVNVSQTELPNFIKTADSLRIRGLSDSSHRLQELASQAAELPADTSQSRTNPTSQSTEATPNRSAASPSRSSTPTVRRSKRLRSESPHEAVVPNIRKSGVQEKRVPVVQLAPIDAVGSGDRKESASSLPRSTPQTASPAVTGIKSNVVAPAANSHTPMVVIPSSADEESASAEDVLCNVMVPKVEMEDADLDREALDNTGAGGEEEWSDLEGQGTAQEESEGWQTQEANNSGVVNGEEGTGNESRFRNQGELQLLDDPPSENEWKMIFTGAGEKRFLCLKCNKHYKRKNHARRHCNFECNSEPRYVCPSCSFRSKRKENLRKHILSHHNSPDVPYYLHKTLDPVEIRDPLAV